MSRLALVPSPSAPLADDAGLRTAMSAHSGELYRFALRALGDRGLAEEAVAETFVRAWRAGERYDPLVASLRTWLFAILRNLIVDATRARAARPVTTPLMPVHDPSIDDGTDAVLQAWLVEEALTRLTPEHRAALVETYYKARPYAEVAAEMGIPVGTLRSRVHYGLRALRLALEEVGWSP